MVTRRWGKMGWQSYGTFPTQPIPREADRGGGDRWLGKIDADISIEPLAALAGIRGGVQRMELLSAGAGDHTPGQEEGDVHADDVQPAARDGFREPPGKLHSADCEIGSDCVRGPVCVYRI